MSKDGLDKEQRAEFISKLNAYLIGQVKTTVNEIATNFSEHLHEDIAKEL